MANEVAVRVGGLTVGALQNVAENRHIITSDGELLDVTLATDDDLVIWSIVTQRLRTLARNIEQGVNAELADRVRRTGGAITTPQGKATETISRGSVSGVAGPRGSGRGEDKKIDYKAVLSEGAFAVFSLLRDLRKTLAEAEGVPIYAVFTNEQLAKAARKNNCRIFCELW